MLRFDMTHVAKEEFYGTNKSIKICRMLRT